MKLKNKGFSLIELLVVISIFSVLLLISTDRFIIGAIKSNNNYNQEIDLQSGVKTSMDNMKNMLKKSVQVHLVGKEVYKPDMNLGLLDKEYNYIGFREEKDGSRFLANIVYNKDSNQFDVIPLMSIDKNDNLNNSDIKYALEFYKKDSNYKKKMEKNILNLTVKGVSEISGVSNENKNAKKFELTEDLILPNVNQILISRHLKGNLDDITAIAYDDGLIRPGKRKPPKVGIVFIIDASASMKHSMDGNYLFLDSNGEYYKSELSRQAKYNSEAEPLYIVDKDGNYIEDKYGNLIQATDLVENKYKILPDRGPYKLSDISTVKKIDDKKNPGKKKDNSEIVTRKVVLQDSLNHIKDDKDINDKDGFLISLSKTAIDKNIDLLAYIFSYHHNLQYHDIDADVNKNYLYPLSTLENKGYGPYKLKEKEGLDRATTYISTTLGMSFNPEDHNKEDGYYEYNGYVDINKKPVHDAGTNTGNALLQGLEMLKQLQEQGIKQRYLILLSDGVPTYYTSVRYKDSENKDKYEFMVNKKTYKDKNAIGTRIFHSEVESMNYIKKITEKSSGNNNNGLYTTAYLIGFSSLKKEKEKMGFNKEKDSIYGYLSSTGNDVRTYDADNKAALDDALSSISREIAINLGIFDGPDKMRKE